MQRKDEPSCSLLNVRMSTSYAFTEADGKSWPALSLVDCRGRCGMSVSLEYSKPEAGLGLLLPVYREVYIK